MADSIKNKGASSISLFQRGKWVNENMEFEQSSN